MSVYLRKKFLESETGQKFLNLLTSIVDDGKVTEEELDSLLVFLSEEEENLPTQNQSIVTLKDKINEIYGDGIVDSEELESLFELLLKIIPKSYREPLLVKIKQIRKEEQILEDRKNYPPTEKQFNYIRSLGGDESHIEQLRECSRWEVSNYIDELKEVRKTGPSHRQMMLLKFWGKDELKKFQKMSVDDVSDWIDDFIEKKDVDNNDYEESWELFKEENPHISRHYGVEGVDLIERGIGKVYLKKVRQIWREFEKGDLDEIPFSENTFNSGKSTPGKTTKDGCLVTFIGISLSFLTLVVCLLVKIFN